MSENEKKVTELNEKELGDISGGFITPDEHYGDNALVKLVCPKCEKRYSTTLKGYHSSGALCPECGTFGTRIG